MSSVTQKVIAPSASSKQLLPEVTLHKLREFGRRRWLLEISRGLAISCILAALSLCIGVAIDSLWENFWARWIASAIFYGTTVSAISFFCIPWGKRASLARHAIEMESQIPGLRHRLLNALELAASAGGSRAFREALQREVAAQMADVEVTKLLPWDRVRKSLLGALFVCFFWGMLCMVPAWHMSQRMARTVFPFANLARITDIVISIARPDPHSTLIPWGDVIAIQAAIQGTPPEQVWLETDDGKTRQELRMSPLDQGGPSERAQAFFATTLAVEWKSVQYRVVAGHASTPWYELTTKPRPAVEQFSFVVQPPEYAAETDRSLVKRDGNFVALEGSRITLGVQANESLTHAEMQWLPAKVGESPTELIWDSTRSVYTCNFEAFQTRSYRIGLVSAKTGFENSFSEEYEIQVYADEPPSVAWLAPVQSYSPVVAEDIVDCAAQGADEFSLAKLEYHLRVNSGQWMRYPISLPADSANLDSESDVWDVPWEASWPLDLKPLNLQAGDTLEAKVVAVDRKGQIGESELREWQVSSTSIDLQPTESERLRLALAKRLEAMSAELEALVVEEVPATVLADSLQKYEQSFKRNLIELLQLRQKAAQATNDGVGTVELRLVGDMLLQLSYRVQQELPSFSGEGETELMRRALESVHRDVQSVVSGMRAFVSHDIGRRHAELVQQIATAEHQLALDAMVHSGESVRRKQRVLLRQLMSIVQDIYQSSSDVAEINQRRYQSFANHLATQAERMERQLEAADGSEIAKQVLLMAKELDVSRLFSRIDGNLYERQRRSQQKLANGLTPSPRLIRDLLREPTWSEADKSQLLEQFGQRRQIRRESESTDREFAKDLGQAKRALAKVFRDYSTEQQRDRVAGIQEAMQVLELASELKQAKLLLTELDRNERWYFETPVATVGNPRLWDTFVTRVEQASRRAEESRELREFMPGINELRWSKAAQAASQRIGQRRWDLENRLSAASQLNELSQQLAKVESELATAVQEARAVLDREAPSLVELARKAARETRELSDRTARLGQDVTKQSDQANDIAMEQLRQARDQASLPIQALREALVDRAEARNLLEPGDLYKAQAEDAGVQIVERAEQQMVNSLERVPSNPAKRAEQETSLQSAAQMQQDVSIALDELARVFGDLQRNRAQDAEEFRRHPMQDLEKIAQSVGGEQQGLAQNSIFDEAQRLAELARQSPEQLLQALEKELNQDSEMQSTISDIARAIAEQSLESLEHAAEGQAALERELENSDPQIAAQKQLVANDVHVVRRQASHLADDLLREASIVAKTGKAEATAARLESLAGQLRQTADRPQLAFQDVTLADMQSDATEILQTLERTSKQVVAARDELKQGLETPVHRNGADLNNRRRDMQDRLVRANKQDLRGLQEIQRIVRNQLQQAERELKRTQQKQAQEQQKLVQIKQRAANSNAEDWDTRLEEQLVSVALSDMQLAVQEVYLQEMQERSLQATKRLEEADRKENIHLSSVNPSVELSAELADRVHERLHIMVESLAPWQADNPSVPQATATQLTSSADRQSELQEQVNEVSQDLERAGRHEARLAHHASSQQLDETAKATEQASHGELEESLRRLDSAASQARTNSQTGQAAPSSMSSTLEATRQAEQAIRRSASGLESLLNRAASKQDAPENASSAVSNASPSEASQLSSLSSKQKAQLLDELDRQTHQPPSLGEQDNSSQNPSSSGSPLPPSTLATAARQLAQQLRRSQLEQVNAPNSDLAVGTEAMMANATPQGPSAVRLNAQQRANGAWGELRERRAEGTVETRRTQLAPRFQEQVEAYFRNLSRSEVPE